MIFTKKAEEQSVRIRILNELHRLREQALPKFLNPAGGIRSSDKEHAKVHAYFERLKLDQEWPDFSTINAEKKEIVPKASAQVRSLVNAKYVVFGRSVSVLFGQILCILWKRSLDQTTVGSTRVRPTMLYGTTHEYPGLIQFARRRYIDDTIFTKPMFSMYDSLLPNGMWSDPMEVKLYEPDTIETLLGQVRKQDMQTIIVVSHVSRIDGRIVPIEKIDAHVKEINKTRSDDTKVYLIVDGSQAIGSMEVDLTGFEGIYLFTSSKALCAEPCVGVAVANEAYASIIESMKPETSLPELDSLTRILSETDFSKVYPELARIKSEVMRLMRKIPRVSIPSDFRTSPYMVYFSIPGLDQYDIERKTRMEGFEIHTERPQYNYTDAKSSRISYTVETPWAYIEEFAQFLTTLVKQL